MENIKFVKTNLKKDQLLINTSAPSHPDFGVTDVVRKKQGEEVSVMIKKYEDGRIYYTCYVEEGGKFYCYTHMRNAKGELYPNCGGICASEDLKRIFKK